MEVIHYLTPQDKDPFDDWLLGFYDRLAQARILTRIGRMAAGNMGDFKAVGEGVSELKIDYAGGYRIYFARVGAVVLILLTGGDKNTQQADIETAIAYLKDWKKRTKK
jgi:putative addiction module killer protein